MRSASRNRSEGKNGARAQARAARQHGSSGDSRTVASLKREQRGTPSEMFGGHDLNRAVAMSRWALLGRIDQERQFAASATS